MRHFGDITKLHGKDLPPVDIICGGSPCQDLSVAGKRAGLEGERSSLFLDQIRIIRELHNECRQSDVDIRPRFMVWENVPGALSSNNGEDFRAVLEQTARVADDNAVIPRLPDGVAWSNAGAVMGDRWSLAWRIHNSQFWGVPQRRARLCLVADFICDTLRAEGVDQPTMASLFDGIGGFPLVFSRCGCEPVWASEIEEFPIAVTKYHFPENNEEATTDDK